MPVYNVNGTDMANLLLVFVKDWPEVWALLIPLLVLLKKGRQPAVHTPVILYIMAALLINLLIDLIWKFKWMMYGNQQYNGFLYNVHSIVRFLLFDQYFSKIQPAHATNLKRGIQVAFIAFVLINFGFFEKFFDPSTPFSGRLLCVEAILLLVLCLNYYFSRFATEEESGTRQPDFWIVTGLSMYVVINFFIFLLYSKLSQQSVPFGVALWNMHNISYIALNLFFAKAFYEAGK